MRRCLPLLLLIFCSLGARATGIEAAAGFALFQPSQDSTYLDLYWEVFPASLRYKKDSAGRLQTRIHTQIRVTADSGVVHEESFYLLTKPFLPQQEAAPRILNQVQIPLGKGRFKVELFLAEDGRAGSRFYYQDTLRVAVANPQYSTLELLDTFFESSLPSPFLRHGFQCLPRALNFYDEGQQQVHSYAELYRTNTLPADVFPLRQLCYISREKQGRDLGVMQADTIRSPAAALVFRNSLSTASLPTGNYWLNLSLRTAAGVELATASCFFQTINAHPIAGKGIEVLDSAEARTVTEAHLLDLGKTFIAKYNMAQLRAILKMLRPAATGSEAAAINGFLAKPDDLYMRYFIYNHFSLLNPKDPDKAWEAFTNEVREVNRLFGSGGTPGFETDRGIIWLRYGKPDEIVRVPNESGALPYEIWRYNPNSKMHGPGLFLFYSPGSMASDFRLLHSTVLGETQNPDWRVSLYGTGSNGSHLNARAEEYFGKQ